MKPKFRSPYRPQAAAKASLLLSLCSVAWLSADPVLVDPEISITAPSSIRAVAGTTLQPLNFSTTNLITGSDTAFGLSLSAGSVGSINNLKQPDATIIPGGIRTTSAPFNNVSLLAGNTGTISATPSITGVLAGQTSTFGLTATNAAWNASVTSNTSINVVDNRLLTGSASIDAGRHMAGIQSIGNITLNGGALTGAQGTNISINSGGYAQLANGIRLTSATDFTFNGADQTHDLQASYNRRAGAYSINTALPGVSGSAVNYSDASGDKRQDFGGSWTTSAEYGNILGNYQTFTEQNPGDWDTYPEVNKVWLIPGSGGYSSSDWIYNQQLATTSQPNIPAVRLGDSNGGLQTEWELSRGAGNLVNQRVNPLITGEVIQGSSLDLSGVSLNITGTAVFNRQIHSSLIDLGRRIVIDQDSSNPNGHLIAINRSDTTTLSTFGSDDQATRLTLGEFSLNSNGVGAVHNGTSQFSDGAATAQVAVSGNFIIDGSVNGRFTRSLDVGGNISGENLAGANTQGTLTLGYTWNNILNNTLDASDLLIFESVGTDGLRAHSTFVRRDFNTDTHTAIGYSGNSISYSGFFSQGLTSLGSSHVAVIAEGLAGEQAGSTSFNTKLATVAGAAFAFTNTGVQSGPLGHGNVITLRDNGNGIFQNNLQISDVSISGGQNLDFQVAYGGGSQLLEHGASRTFTVEFIGDFSAPAAGQLGRVFRSDLSIGLSDKVNLLGIYNASRFFGGELSGNFTGNDLGAVTYALETRFDAPAASSGTSTAAAGSNFRNNGLSLDNTAGNTSARFVTYTGLELIDSATLTSSTTVHVEFVKLDAADPALIDALEDPGSNAASIAGIYGGGQAEFASDIVELTGLDGVLQVVQVGYDETVSPNEAGAQLLWKYDYMDAGGNPQVAWINAVLGNSNITMLDLVNGTLTAGAVSGTIQDFLTSTRHAGSYEDYLASNSLIDPMLGAWGVDTTNNNVWSVIDHNSSFAAAVPEPGTVTLLFLASTALLLRRRKS